ncbi:MAG TPA: hypothetical protein ENJ90_03850 [Devosia sp.]|nr:hypothetical protein [Devosia sp.]
MWDFRLSQAIGLMIKTAPFILLRMAIYFGITLAFIVVTGAGAGLGWGLGSFSTEPGTSASFSMWGGIFGFGLTAGVIFLAREYLLYMVKAAHIAVLVELLDGKEMPQGRSQIEHGQAVVRERFAQANVLFVLDRIIQGVLRAITGAAQGIASLVPIPGLQQLMGLVRSFLNIAVGFVDEVILAYLIRSRAENPWGSARDALILYGQNYKIMLKNAAWLTIIIYGLALLLFIFLLAPAGVIAILMPGSFSAFGIVIALLLAWSIKAALLEPLAIACMMQVYFPAIEGQTPDPEWEQRLNDVSAKFRDMGEKAANWVGSRSGSPSN